MQVKKRNKRQRGKVNPEGAGRLDAFAEDGMVILRFGDAEVALDAQQADNLAELIADALEDASEESEEGEEGDEDEVDEDGE